MSNISRWLSGVLIANNRLPSGEIAIGRPCRVSKVRNALWAFASVAPSARTRHITSEAYARRRIRSRFRLPAKRVISDLLGYDDG
jgi:hypothetical protein